MVQVGEGVGKKVLYDSECFRALASPTKLYPKTKGYNFQKLFMVVAVPLFLSKWFVRLPSESGVLVF